MRNCSIPGKRASSGRSGGGIIPRGNVACKIRKYSTTKARIEKINVGSGVIILLVSRYIIRGQIINGKKTKQYVTILRYGDFIHNMIMYSVTETQRPVKKQKIQKNSNLRYFLPLIKGKDVSNYH